MAGSDLNLERPPEAMKQRLGEGDCAFSRTPENVSVGEKGAVEGIDLGTKVWPFSPWPEGKITKLTGNGTAVPCLKDPSETQKTFPSEVSQLQES